MGEPLPELTQLPEIDLLTIASQMRNIVSLAERRNLILDRIACSLETLANLGTHAKAELYD